MMNWKQFANSAHEAHRSAILPPLTCNARGKLSKTLIESTRVQAIISTQHIPNIRMEVTAKPAC
jgi:hypothetical protein